MNKWKRVWPSNPMFSAIPWDAAQAQWGHITHTITTSSGVEEQAQALGFLGVCDEYWHFQVTGRPDIDARIAR